MKEQTGVEYIDSFLYMWLLMLGEFDVQNLKNGPTGGIVMYILFFLASFFLVVILLNMQIAIMQDTYSRTVSTYHETSYKNRVQLMVDHIWLIDLKEEFKNKQAIIRILPQKSVKQQQGDIVNKLSDLDKSLNTKFEQNISTIIEHVSSFEKEMSLKMKLL